MWGTRLVRSCGRQEFSWTALQVAIRNLSLEARLGSNDVLREVSESVGGSRANGMPAARCSYRHELGYELISVREVLNSVHVLQQRMGIKTMSDSLRAASDTGEGLQKEPILRPKDVDVEEEVDDETHEDAGVGPGDQSAPGLSLAVDLQGAPRRKQRFLLQKALKIRNVEVEGRPQRRGFSMKVVDVNRTCKVTKEPSIFEVWSEAKEMMQGGGILSFTALVICGNGDGVAGFGKGKSAEISAAVDKAYARALRNLHYFERFEGHTIFHEKDTKYGKTKIYMWPAQSGTGMRASHTVGGILRLAGFKDVKTKVVGSRHPHNTVKAVFQALSEIETPEEVAERKGRAMVQGHCTR